jgi:hypothetical protein
MENGLHAAAVEIKMRFFVIDGNCFTRLIAVMPPIDGPMIECRVLMPNSSMTGFMDKAMSSIVTSGKESPYFRFVSGLKLAGPEEP